MMVKETKDKRDQIQFVSVSALVPENHLLRDIEKAIDFSFIYELVEDKYCQDNGRPSVDPVMLIKIPLIQYLYGITSMRQTIKEIEVNVAYRWFLGLDLTASVPHFTTFGKNYTRRFKDTDLFEQIFKRILEECFYSDLVDPSVIFVDGTHIKASANKRKSVKILAQTQALHYEEELFKEINEDRIMNGKKDLKERDDDNHKDNNDDNQGGGKTTAQSITDPDCGMFHKGEHKKEFAYVTQTACDKNGWILDYTIHPGNQHDSRTFKTLYDKIKELNPTMITMDAGYKTPAIARMLLMDDISPLFPYTRPRTKDGFFTKWDYVYDEFNNCFLCPGDQIIKYSTTNRDGYREFKSDNRICGHCQHLKKCTDSKNHVKVVTQHIWSNYMELCEDIRYSIGAKEIYGERKKTIERIFGTAKEYHGMRYTRQIGKSLMEMKVGLTFACMNLKKLAKMKRLRGEYTSNSVRFFENIANGLKNSSIEKIPSAACCS